MQQTAENLLELIAMELAYGRLNTVPDPQSRDRALATWLLQRIETLQHEINLVPTGFAARMPSIKVMFVYSDIDGNPIDPQPEPEERQLLESEVWLSEKFGHHVKDALKNGGTWTIVVRRSPNIFKSAMGGSIVFGPPVFEAVPS